MIDPAQELAAALCSPWPTWWVEAPDEATLLAHLRTAGPLPQADLFEPWDDEPWVARVVHPPLDHPAQLLQLGRLAPGDPPGQLEWQDRGRILEDVLTTGSIVATALSDADGGVLWPEVLDQGPDALQQAFRRAVGDEEARAIAVSHPASGRRGVRFEVRVPDTHPPAERLAVLDAVASLAESLDPNLRWDFELHKVTVLAWRLSEPTPQQPTDPWSIHVPLEGPAELQVVFPAESHESDALLLAEQVAGLGLVGSRARWCGAHFLACWTGTVQPLDLAHPHRWVPGCPPGLEETWLGVDPTWWGAGSRFVMRVRCGLRDRDLLPRHKVRTPDPEDEAPLADLRQLGSVESVQGGYRLQLPPLTPDAFESVVLALGHLPQPLIGPVLYVRFGQRTTLWLPRTDLDDETPVWSAP